MSNALLSAVVPSGWAERKQTMHSAQQLSSLRWDTNAETKDLPANELAASAAMCSPPEDALPAADPIRHLKFEFAQLVAMQAAQANQNNLNPSTHILQAAWRQEWM